MKYEHWRDPRDGGPADTIFDEHNPTARKMLSRQAWRCCVIEADSWTEAMAKYHEHQGWEPYVPMDDNA